MMTAAIVNVHLFSVNIQFKSNIFLRYVAKGTLLLLTSKNVIPALSQLMTFTVFFPAIKTNFLSLRHSRNPYPPNTFLFHFYSSLLAISIPLHHSTWVKNLEISVEKYTMRSVFLLKTSLDKSLLFSFFHPLCLLSFH